MSGIVELIGFPLVVGVLVFFVCDYVSFIGRIFSTLGAMTLALFAGLVIVAFVSLAPIPMEWNIEVVNLSPLSIPDTDSTYFLDEQNDQGYKPLHYRYVTNNGEVGYADPYLTEICAGVVYPPEVRLHTNRFANPLFRLIALEPAGYEWYEFFVPRGGIHYTVRSM